MKGWRRLSSLSKKVILFINFYILTIIVLRLLFPGSLSILVNIINPIMATGGAFALWAIAGSSKRRPLRKQADKTYAIFSIMMLWGIIYFLSGLMTTYLKNSLISGVLSILINAWIYLLPAVFIEIIRYYVVKLAGRRNINLLPFIAIQFTLLHLMLYNFPLFNNGTDVFEYIMVNIIPLLVSSMVLTFLAWTAGLAAMLTYQVMNTVLAVFLPIIPNYDWYATGMTSILVALVIFFVIDSMRQDKKNRRIHYDSRSTTKIQMMTPIIILIGLILFMTGMLSYRPIAIMSNSMKPYFSRGDMVIVQRVSPTMDIGVGDIVEYSIGNKLITHRVIEVLGSSSESEVKYITKGDNSPAADELPVAYSQIRSIIRVRIPLIGYPTVMLYEFIGNMRSGGVH